VPLLKSMLVRQWLRPSDFKTEKQFRRAYDEALAWVDISEKFLTQFDPISIDERLKELRKQIIKEEARNAG